ncbi:molybdate ABC transporter permease subunit [Tissierella sp. Yu-01]|uniref:molybdate ABC transporter permease subunit n=1 Tax=Tissierella sp. Yu-01 TaxID=3035694 RepID=UPI00240E0987|nr:molybdate ABC transporter permease subunit [Tissierella sp. Yu-01]WFA09019.1 molybdate ABC transporter permease subunit [Tissierella sp. Yu-01]
MDFSPLILSIKAALFATIITFILGIYSAYFTLKLNKLKGIVDGLFTLPLVLPPTVVGFLLLVLLGKNSTIGKFLLNYDITIVFSGLATIIASIVVSFPLMYRTARGAFEQLDINLIYVARTLGLSEHEIFWKIMIPNCFSSIISGTILAFARALGEFGATIMIAGNIPGKTQTMAVAVYSAVQAGNRSLAYKWVSIIVIISFATMILLNLIESGKIKKLGKGGY